MNDLATRIAEAIIELEQENDHEGFHETTMEDDSAG